MAKDGGSIGLPILREPQLSDDPWASIRAPEAPPIIPHCSDCHIDLEPSAQHQCMLCQHAHQCMLCQHADELYDVVQRVRLRAQRQPGSLSIEMAVQTILHAAVVAIRTLVASR